MHKDRNDRLEQELRIIKQYGLEPEILALCNAVRALKDKNIPFYTFTGIINSMLTLSLFGITRIDPVELGIGFYAVPYGLSKNGKIYSIFISDTDGVNLFNQEYNRFLSQENNQRKIEIETRVVSSTFEECCALNALNRPGPIEAGILNEFIERSKTNGAYCFGVKEIDDILKETYGLVIYNEQVVDMLTTVMDISALEAEAIRRDIVKRIAKVKDAYEARFINSDKLKGVGRCVRDKIWHHIYTSIQHCFYKSHIASIVPRDYSYWVLFKYEMLCRVTNE